MNSGVKVEEVLCPTCDLRDLHTLAQDHYSMMVNRLDSMFKWNIGDDEKTIPVYILERYLKLTGWAGIGHAPETYSGNKDSLYCFVGGLGLQPDEYYQPTAIVMANPVLGSKTYRIGEDVVWAKNDSLYRGLSQHLSRYAHLLAANDISVNVAQVATRMPFVITAETEAQVLSAEKYVSDAERGKLAIIKSSAFNNGVEVKPTFTSGADNYLKALIELNQYLKAQWSMDIGISSNFNMKRERQNVAEVESNAPYLLPLVDEMLKFRKIACEEVNKKFGRNWSVELDSAWKLESETQKLDVALKENEVQVTKPDSQQSAEPEEVKEDEE